MKNLNGRQHIAGLLAAVSLLLMLFLPGCGTSSEETFQPAVFEWSGGSGRIEMTCEQVRIEKDQAYATIVIDSSHYSWLKVDGKEYETKHEGETSKAEIPVILDEKMEISGLTTAMSQPHEVTYTILVGSERADSSQAGSSASGEAAGAAAGEDQEEAAGQAAETPEGPPEIEGLTYSSAMETEYAGCFDVYYYQDGYKVLDVHEGARYLLIPEGMDVPEGVQTEGQSDDAVFGTVSGGERVVLVRQPLQNVYLAATAVMALVSRIDALDAVRLTGTDADGWYLDAPKEALKAGDILFAGKYSEPDYETLIQEGCDLAVESTMINHTPEVQEKLEDLGIPVLVDHSSYENHPLGRAEWIRFYGILFGREEQAEQAFAEQKAILSELESFENTGKTVVFFYISQDGTAVVRSADDYIPAMIELAGGKYLFDDLKPAAGSSAAVTLSMEEFYAAASDADYLIYNASIDAPLGDMKDLLAKSELFSEFKAVQNGQVWTTYKNLYQATDSIAEFVKDLHLMLTDGNEADMLFLKKVTA